ncbi:GtrA family protein [Streptomyces sp. O3]
MLESTPTERHTPAWVRKIWREVAAFGAVGAVAFLVETASFNLLILGSAGGGGPLRGAPVLASAVATLLAMAVSWFGNRHWTYRDRKGRIDRREVAWFLAANLAGLVVTAVPVYVAHELLGLSSPLSDNAARLFGWSAATLLRFTVYRSLVFAPAREDSAPVPGVTGRRAAALRGGPYWPWVLGAAAAVCGYAVSVVFHPGFLSQDSVEQWLQAEGVRPVTDWHPPVMALLWRTLVDVTGALAAMAALQAAVLWGTLWVLAVVVWKRTGSRPLSLLVLAIGLAPHVMTFTGVVWKDTHMAYALLAACAVALLARELPAGRDRTRWALLALGVLFLGYAILVRKNGFPAVVPVFVLLVLALWPKPGRRRWLIAVGSLLAVTAVGGVVVSSVTQPVATRQYAQIPLDDVVHVLTPEQVRTAAETAGADPEFRDALVATAQKCQRRDIPTDAYFACYPRTPGDRAIGPSIPADHADVLVSMWVRQMPRHAADYVAYRTRVFARFLFQSNLPYFNGDWPGTPDNVTVNPELNSALRSYVTGFVRDVPVLFQGWFWLALALVLALRRRWRGPWSRELRLLGASAVLYLATYLPTAPESNYRYMYWPALACTLAAVLIASSRLARRRAALDASALDASAPDASAPDRATPADGRVRSRPLSCPDCR